MTNLQLTSYSIVKAESFSFKIKTRMPTLTTFIQHNVSSPSYNNLTKKEWKSSKLGKRSKTVTICRWHDTIYWKSPPKTLLELINAFSKVAGYKINIKKSVAFLYTNNELSERESKMDFPGGPVSKTPHSYHRGPRFDPWSGN